MNRNEMFEDDYPEWLSELLDRHGDLAVRSDCPMNAVGVLLSDAADLLKELDETSYHEQAVTAELRDKLVQGEMMISDALRLEPLSPSTPEVGIVTLLDDGTRRWSPAGADQNDNDQPALRVSTELENEGEQTTPDERIIVSIAAVAPSSPEHRHPHVTSPAARKPQL